MIPSNYHTHTDFCDGSDSPEDIVLEAVRLGCPEIGFSGHSYTAFDESWCMSKQGTAEYKLCVNRLKEKYAGQIKILLGVEQDYFSNEPCDGYDYVIGSVHYVKKDGKYLPVDESREIQRAIVKEYYGGDFYAFAEDYFALVEKASEKTNADIIGHFDLVSKYSEKNGYGESPRFLAAAEKAVRALIPYGLPFEINTGAMARGVRSVPYPSPEILKMIRKHGGQIMLSSDCHNKDYLDFAFDKAADLARKTCFTRTAVIKNGKIGYMKL